MSLHRIYVDEVGTHDLTHADDPNQRFLSLTGVVFESDHTLNVLRPEMDQIKREFLALTYLTQMGAKSTEFLSTR